MDAPDNPTSPKEVELTEVDDKPPPEKKKTKQLTVDVEITFCTHVGWDGVLVMLFSLGIAGLFIYITHLYTKKFQVWHRPGVWVFMVFAVLYLLLVANWCWTWRKVATAFTEQQQAVKKDSQGVRTRTRSAVERVKQVAGEAKNVYRHLQVNGKWFLWKLYASELYESVQQCINLVTVYLLSLFDQAIHLEMAETQEGKVPRPVRVVAAACKGFFGLFFLVVAVVHLASKPTGCDVIAWEKGCVNKIPFCKSLLEPTCNCASLHIENNKSLVKLPDSLVDEMTGLRKVFIRNCNLTKLPPRMEQLTEMVDFEISFNRLEEFNVDVRKWEKLDKIHLMQNNISSYNENALFSHSSLGYLRVSNNMGMKFPSIETNIAMPSLMMFAFANNSVRLNGGRFNNNHFPNLLYLYLNGNYLINFPDTSLKDTLQYLGIARCGLNKLPPYFGKLNQLRYLDARDNNISFVKDDVKMLINRNNVESYFSGNVVCETDEALDCEPLCSKYCWSRHVSNDAICDIQCNSKECEYDGGDCL
eukprot:g8605.t1